MPYFRFPFPLGESEVFDYEKDEHEILSERLRKTLYYGKLPNTERPSLPLTDIAVELLQESTPRKLGKIDHYMMASTTRENCISPCTMMMGMIYVNRLKTKNPEYLQKMSSSDLFLISMMMASKFMYDEGVDEEVFNDEWANSVDMETEEINSMERNFLSAIDWNLFIGEKEFSQLLHNLESSIALRQGRDRGWFTYTDLMVLSQNAKILEISQELSKVILVSSLTYLTGILTMIGSTVLVTAATASLGPIILQSQTRPLPVIDIMPVVEVANDNNETETKPQPNVQSKQGPEFAKESFDFMLAELMTMISLPSSLVKFWYSTLDQYKSVKMASKKMKMENKQLLCSNGPCLPSAKPNCQNVTNHNGLELWDLGACSDCLSCNQNSKQNGNGHRLAGSFRPSQNMDSPMDNPYDVCRRLEPSCYVRCCCDPGTSWTLTDSLSMNMFLDVPVRFNTGPGHHNPIYVTT